MKGREEKRRGKKKRQGARRKKGDVTCSWWQPIRDGERQRGSQERVCFPRTAASAVKRGHNQSDTEQETQEPSGTDKTTESPEEDGNPKLFLNCRGKWRRLSVTTSIAFGVWWMSNRIGLFLLIFLVVWWSHLWDLRVQRCSSEAGVVLQTEAVSFKIIALYLSFMYFLFIHIVLHLDI